MRLRILALLLVLVVAAGLATVGRPLLPQWMLHIEGRVQGQDFEALLLGRAALAPVSGTVRCNGIATTIDQSGAYALTLPVAPRYACEAGGPTYTSQEVVLDADYAGALTMNFSKASGTCEFVARMPVLACPALRLRDGGLRGVVTGPNGTGSAQEARVECAPVAAQNAQNGLLDSTSATTNASGAFALTSMFPGDYYCLATSKAGGAAAKTVRIMPGETPDLRLAICIASCPPVRYHGGQVMHTMTAYLVFWLPGGYAFEPGGNDDRYRALITRYFQDVGGSAYYGLLAQYFDFRGPVQNNVTLGGVYRDPTPYQHCAAGGACRPAAATQADPLTGEDVEAEIRRALAANQGWNTGLDSEVFVYTGAGVEECDTADASALCTFKDREHSFCAYHSAMAESPRELPTIYSYMPDPSTRPQGCTIPSGPNGDRIAESAVDFSAHEQFESVTDPVQLSEAFLAWYDEAEYSATRNDGEIADKCNDQFGPVGGDGGNVTLGNGHRYLLQEMWSNGANGCALA